jgi:hypothetical protein
MASPVHSDYRRCQAEIPLIVLCRFPEPALYLDPGLQKRIIQDCHKACGEFIAFSIGIRHENVEIYHRTIKEWIAEGLSSEEMLPRIERLMTELR